MNNELYNRRKEEFARIEEERGGLVKPEDIFEAARDPDSAFHQDFEWDVQKAFQKHNLEIARGVIREFKVVAGRVPVRQYHSVTLVRGGRAYADIQRIRKEPSWREEVAYRLWNNLHAAARDLVVIIGAEELRRRFDAMMIELTATKDEPVPAEPEKEVVY